MTLFETYSRDQLRRSYVDAWKKQLAGSPLSPLEAMLADVVGAHPEYQAILGDSESALSLEATNADAAENPFLHMGLHMAIREQVAIDRPPGVRGLREALQASCGGLHDAEHILMESLAETLWDAQRAGRPPDENRYLRLVRLRLRPLLSFLCVIVILLPPSVGRAATDAGVPAGAAPTSMPDNDAAAKHAKLTGCLKQAKAKKLVGAQKTAFIKECLAI